jgi:hypothetical protein
MERWLEECTFLFYNGKFKLKRDQRGGADRTAEAAWKRWDERSKEFCDDLKHRKESICTPCLSVCDDHLRRVWMETAHNTRKGLWDGPPFPDQIIVSSNMYLEGKLNPYRSPLCPEHRCVKCDENRAYINEREARPKKNEVGRHADMCSRVVFTAVRPAHTNPWKPDPRHRRWVCILVSRREVIQEGRKLVIETPVFPGYTPEVTTRYLHEEGNAKKRYKTRAKQTAAKATSGPSHAAPTAQGKQHRDSTGDSKAGLPETAAQPLSKRMKKILNRRKRAAQTVQDQDVP